MCFKNIQDPNLCFQNFSWFHPWESPSDFGITNFSDIEECNRAIFMCFLCAFPIFKTRTPILKIYLDIATLRVTLWFEHGLLLKIIEWYCAIFMCFSCAFLISNTRTPILKIYSDRTLEGHPLIWASPVFRYPRMR